MRFQRDPFKIATVTLKMVNGFEFVPNGYHPFSYYVLGGIDVAGDSMLLSGNPISDSDGDLTSASDAGFGYDPRLGPFDIAEQAGADVYEDVRRQAMTAARSESQSEESSGESESSEKSE